MERKLIMTKDGSHTVEIPELHTNYHSIHGAIQESMHVFIRAGLEYFFSRYNKKNISVFEMGFGTGLNALLTLDVAQQKNLSVYYHTVELYPLKKNEYEKLNYCDDSYHRLKKEFSRLHKCDWEEDVTIVKNFILHKSNISLLETKMQQGFDIVFFDAFDPNIQPELWTPEIFKKLYDSMNEHGVFVTYSSKGNVRRALIAAGFSVDKIAGPKGKREMIRAFKP